jgi:glycosyltransferase involved in cell wall biosynthesis
MKKTAILHLVNVLNDSSITRIVQRIILSSDANKFSWFVCPEQRGGDFEDVFAQMGVQIVNISDMKAGFIHRSRTVGKFAAENDINIIHSHTPRTLLATWLALNGKEQIKHLATKHLLNASADRKLGFLYALFDRMSLVLPDHVVAVSKRMGEEIRSFPGVKKDHVSVIQNAIPVEQFFCPTLRQECRAEFQVKTNAALIGYIGRINKVKRIDLLLAAFKGVLERYPNSILLIAGEGELQRQMRDLAQQMDIEQSVRWTGFRSDIPRLLAGIDIFVQPSINEGLSLSLIEAMAAEKAIVATQVGGTSEVIENEKTGMLVAPGSSSNTTRAILHLLDHPEIQSEIAKAAKDLVFRDFNISRMTNEYHHLYENLMRRRFSTD